MNLYPSVVIPATAITAGNALIDSTTLNAFAAPIVSGSPFDFGPYRDGRSFLELYSAGVLVGKALISKSKSAGEATTDLLSGWNLTSGWTNIVNGSPTDADTFTTVGGVGGLSKNILTASKLYRATYSKNTTASASVLRISNSSNVAPSDIADIVSGTKYFTGVNLYTYAYLRNADAGVTDVLSLAMENVTSPAATACLCESSPGVRGWIHLSATAWQNSSLTFKIVKGIRVA